jgi:AraC family transcriptional activator of mtrCDE
VNQPFPGSLTGLDRLIEKVHVEFERLAHCLVSPGWRLSMPAVALPAIHYSLSGNGSMRVGSYPSIDLTPHTLVICPPRRAVEIRSGAGRNLGKKAFSRWPGHAEGKVSRLVAGNGEPEVTLICGYFRASYGITMDLFANLPAPIVERFTPDDRLDRKLSDALQELMAQQVGSGAMSSALLKQVLVTIMRRSLTSADCWTARFAALSDPKIARVFSEMVSRPGARHTVQTLAEVSGLSRSAFISRFTAALGAAPMTLLRELRMRHARTLLATRRITIEQAAAAVGYSSSRGFLKAYRRTYGTSYGPRQSR